VQNVSAGMRWRNGKCLEGIRPPSRSIVASYIISSYVQSLEERVAYLELQLQQHGHSVDNDNAPVAESWQSATVAAQEPLVIDSLDCSIISEHVNEATQATLQELSTLNGRVTFSEPRFSRVLLERLVRIPSGRTTTICGPLPGFDDARIASNTLLDLDTSPVSLPTVEGATMLVRAYFQFANLSLPLLHEPTFMQHLELLRAMPQQIDIRTTHADARTRTAVFFVFEVFAVALLMLQKSDPARISACLADRYHHLATQSLLAAGVANDLEGVQALLLLAQYLYHHHSAAMVWQIIGAALRLSVELGLHQDQELEGLDSLTLDTMRRTFWVAYAMDRNVSIGLGLPTGLPDGAISAKVSNGMLNLMTSLTGDISFQAQTTTFISIPLASRHQKLPSIDRSSSASMY
jgi:hypothetical protein